MDNDKHFPTTLEGIRDLDLIDKHSPTTSEVPRGLDSIPQDCGKGKKIDDDKYSPTTSEELEDFDSIPHDGGSEVKIDNDKHSPTPSRDLDSIPQDLKTQIMLRLPATSVGRVACVSKLFAPIIHSHEFVHSFLARSLTRPRFLFTIRNRDKLSFFSSTPYDEAPVSVTGTECRTGELDFVYHSAGGLICCKNRSQVVICNPTTGQVVFLPEIRSRLGGLICFFGYDPIDHQYKVLCVGKVMGCEYFISQPVGIEEYRVFTLGAQKSWRMIECGTRHSSATEGLCLNGALYYVACAGKRMEERVLVCFDVRSERFDFIRLAADIEKSRVFYCNVINYRGKVALVDGGHFDRNDMWVLEDATKHEWSKMRLPHQFFEYELTCIRGTIQTGEVIFAPPNFRNPFYLTYYNVERNSVRRVQIEGIVDTGFSKRYFPKECKIWTFPDHVENIMRM